MFNFISSHNLHGIPVSSLIHTGRVLSGCIVCRLYPRSVSFYVVIFAVCMQKASTQSAKGLYIVPLEDKITIRLFSNKNGNPQIQDTGILFEVCKCGPIDIQEKERVSSERELFVWLSKESKWRRGSGDRGLYKYMARNF